VKEVKAEPPCHRAIDEETMALWELIAGFNK